MDNKKMNSELSDKELEAVSGGKIGIDIDPETLRKMNKDAEILVKLDNEPNPVPQGGGQRSLDEYSLIK